MESKWIVITGMDGSGKTTLKKNLVEHFSNRGENVKDFKLPYDKHLLSLLDVSGGGKAFEDNYTDRLIFVLDNRIVNYHIKSWKEEYDLLISQRGFLDSFVFGSVQGFSYKEVAELNRLHELEKCDILIHLNADYKVAYDRIKNDPKGDKFETLEHMKVQHDETRKAYEELVEGVNPLFAPFASTKNVYIDTTDICCEKTFEIAIEKLKPLLN